MSAISPALNPPSGLASGQHSTITGTLPGQIVMEGSLDIRLPAWLRRLITSLIAIIPAVIVTAIYGEQGAGSKMGPFVNSGRSARWPGWSQ